MVLTAVVRTLARKMQISTRNSKLRPPSSPPRCVKSLLCCVKRSGNPSGRVLWNFTCFHGLAPVPAPLRVSLRMPFGTGVVRCLVSSSSTSGSPSSSRLSISVTSSTTCCSTEHSLVALTCSSKTGIPRARCGSPFSSCTATQPSVQRQQPLRRPFVSVSSHPFTDTA